MKKVLILLSVITLFLTSSVLVYSQWAVKVHGVITDSKTNAPIMGATVKILPTEQIGTVSDVAGYYIIPGDYRGQILSISYIGYETLDTLIQFSNQRIDIKLKENNE